MWNVHKIKILSFFLLLSLAGNIGFASWIAGKKTGEISNLRRQRAEAFMEMAQGLPEEQRKSAVQSIKTHRPEMKKAIDSVREQRQAVRALIEQDNVNPEQLDLAFKELRRRTALAQEAGHMMMQDVIPNIPLEQRRSLIENLKN